MSKGKFITFEGIDGSGTTYHSQQLADTLNSFGENIYWTCEPTKSPIGVLLRKYLKYDKSEEFVLPSWETMALLFTADRQNHQRYIEEVLNKGHWVICDRYSWSTYAYQLVMAKIEVEKNSSYNIMDFLNWMYTIHYRTLRPDVIYYIDIEVDTALERIEKANRDTKEIFEHKEMQHKVKDAYEFVKDFFNNTHKVYTFDNETKTKEETAKNIWMNTKKIFKL